MGKSKLFDNGATFVRADFHLHTKADKEFVYNGDENYFTKNYIDQLEKEGIRIGVITNHNKFDESEFKELRKNALKRDIFLLPGVEFSLNNGRKGIHILIVFCDDLFKNIENHNYINQFINGAFSGIHDYDRPPYDTNSNYDFNSLCQTLDKYNKDYFIILAHVDDSSGLFVELDGRGLLSFIKGEYFSKRVLGLQKARSKVNIGKINSITENRTPALVEGTDCAHKGIDGIGKGNECDGVTQITYLKVGDFNFDAVKYALRDHTHRVFNKEQGHLSAYVKSVKFESKRLGEKQLHFSPSMNNFIGIRGSGKSSILESIRYLFDIGLTKNTKDQDYKKNIVQELLGSGGKMTAEIVDNKGQLFIAEKIYNESTNIYFEGELQQNLKLDSIILNPLYFGQKDLSELGNESSTEELIGRLVGNKLGDIQVKIKQQSHAIEDLLRDIVKHNTVINREEELRARKAELELQERSYKLHNIDKILSRQVEFEKDKLKLEAISNFLTKRVDSLNNFWIENKFDIKTLTNYQSQENGETFKDVFANIENFANSFNNIEIILKSIKEEKEKIDNIKVDFSQTLHSMKEEFSSVKRDINIPNINPDTYINIKKGTI